MQRGDLDLYSALTAQSPTQQIDLGHVWEKQYSQELRLASPKGRFIDFVIGAYYLHEPDRENYRRDVTQLNVATGVPLNGAPAVAVTGTPLADSGAWVTVSVPLTGRKV